MNGWHVVGAVLVAGCAGGDSRSGGPGPTATSGARAPEARAAADPAAEILVMSYNLNFGVAGDEGTVELIRAGGADVVFLQETNDTWERTIRGRLSGIYPHIAFRHASRRAGGLGFLSRYPLRLEQYEQSPIGWFPAWRAVVDGPLGRLQLLNFAPPSARPGWRQLPAGVHDQPGAAPGGGPRPRRAARSGAAGHHRR